MISSEGSNFDFPEDELKLRVRCGCKLEETIEEACKISHSNKVIVEFIFNGTKIIIDNKENYKDY